MSTYNRDFDRCEKGVESCIQIEIISFQTSMENFYVHNLIKDTYKFSPKFVISVHLVLIKYSSGLVQNIYVHT